MEYTTEIEIELPRKRVVELFDNPINLSKWQPELLSFEPISGEPGQAGAKARLRYRMNRRDVEMIETVTKRNLPNGSSATYEAPGVMNSVTNRFEKLGKGTRWVVHNDFKCSGFMRFMTLFMSGSFKKQTLKYMRQFKDFAESASPEK